MIPEGRRGRGSFRISWIGTKLALLLLTIAIGPLFYISVWIGLTALLAAYALTAKLANNDFARQIEKRTEVPHHQPKR